MKYIHNNPSDDPDQYPKLFHHRFKTNPFNPWDPANWNKKEAYNIVNKVNFSFYIKNYKQYIYTKYIIYTARRTWY